MNCCEHPDRHTAPPTTAPLETPNEIVGGPSNLTLAFGGGCLSPKRLLGVRFRAFPAPWPRREQVRERVWCGRCDGQWASRSASTLNSPVEPNLVEQGRPRYLASVRGCLRRRGAAPAAFQLIIEVLAQSKSDISPDELLLFEILRRANQRRCQSVILLAGKWRNRFSCKALVFNAAIWTAKPRCQHACNVKS
jgi:hypothetical protein